MKSFLINNHIEYKEKVPIASLTGLGQEGILQMIVYPHSEYQLILIIKKIREFSLSFDIFGSLSNTYLCSSFMRDVIILTTKMKNIVYNKETITVECGYNLTKLARELSSKGIAGYDGLIGIPGTIGAAVINNSGAFNSSMSQLVERVKLLDNDNRIVFLSNYDLKYSTRYSILKKEMKNYILLSSELNISKYEDVERLKERIKRQNEYRRRVVDGKRKSLGSIFVSSSMYELTQRHRFAILTKKIINQPLKLLFNSHELNKYMDFLFLGVPRLAKHCDRLNRFAWDNNTKESDFFDYLDTMQRLAGGMLKLEIEIRK